MAVTRARCCCFRFALAAAVLLPLAARRAASRPSRGTLVGLVLLGAVYVGQSLTYFIALTTTSVALLGLLLYLYPVAVGVLASVLFHIPLTRPRVVSLVLALCGAALTIGPLGGGNWLGIGLGVASALIYSGYILSATRLTRTVDPVWCSAIITAAASVDLRRAGARARRRVAGVWRGLGGDRRHRPGLDGHTPSWRSSPGLTRIGPTDAATVSTLEPAITAVLAVLLLGESLGPLQILGGALIVSAALVVTPLPAPPRSPVRDTGLTQTWMSLPWVARHTAHRGQSALHVGPLR